MIRTVCNCIGGSPGPDADFKELCKFYKQRALDRVVNKAKPKKETNTMLVRHCEHKVEFIYVIVTNTCNI